jgi:hypothetical protein
MMIDSEDDGAEADYLAAALGVAQRRVILSLGSDWGAASDHRTAKRMLHGVRDKKGLIEQQPKAENSWRLTMLGRRVQAVLERDG